MPKRQPEKSDFDCLVSAVYTAVTEPAEWGKALDSVGDALGGAALVFGCTRHGELRFAATNRLDPDRDALLRMHYSRPETNPLLAKMPHLPLMSPVARQEIIGDRAYRDTGLFNDIFRPQGFAHVAITCMSRDHDILMSAGLLKPTGSEFTDEQSRLYTGLLPHFRRAISMTMRLRDLSATLAHAEAAADVHADAILAVDAEVRVLWANAAAERVLAAADGIACRNGRVVCAHAASGACLSRIVAEAARRTAAHGGSVRVPRLDGISYWYAIVMPSPRGPEFEFDKNAALIRLVDPSKRAAAPIERLTALFHLSRAEAELAVTLLEGSQLEEVAKRRGVSMATVRSQLRSVFAKTGTSRQAGLLTLLSRVANYPP